MTGERNSIEWPNFVKFMRQLSHDLRNQLNAVELQAALVGELNKDEELKAELRRLRELVSGIGVALQQLSSAVAPPRPTLLDYSAKDFMSDLEKKIAQQFPEESKTLKWERAAADVTLNIDPSLMEWAVIELLRNAFQHDRTGAEILVKGERAGNDFVISVREQKSRDVDTSAWLRPLCNVAHQHYCLGLRRVHAIAQAHKSRVEAAFDPAGRTLTSKIIIPCSTERP